MPTRVTGTIVRGEGSAARNHAVLMPLLAKHFPAALDFSGFGTINVQLDTPLDKSHADIWTPRVIWHPLHLQDMDGPGRIEMFGFTRIAFEYPPDGALYNSWIMLPEGAPMTYRDDQAEVIADNLIPGIAEGERCAIRIDSAPSVAAPPSFGAMYGKSLNRKSRPAT